MRAHGPAPHVAWALTLNIGFLCDRFIATPAHARRFRILYRLDPEITWAEPSCN